MSSLMPPQTAEQRDISERLAELVRKAKAHVDAMTPAQRRAMREIQKRSWVRSEIGMGSDKDEADYAAAYRAGDQVTLDRLAAESKARLAAFDAREIDL